MSGGKIKFVKCPVLLSLFSIFLLGCASRQDSPATGQQLTGTWIGDFGPAFYDRNTIALELNWDGKSLTGQIVPGDPSGRMYRKFQGFPIENASFNPITGTVKFEATYKAKGRRYIIEGKIKNNTLGGTWTRPGENKDGDFKLTRK